LRQQHQFYPVYGKAFSGNISLGGFPILEAVQDDLRALEAYQ
jgi:hypothetical protein